MPKTLMIVPNETNGKGCKYEEMFLQGKRIQIKKGVVVAVPPIYKEVYEETTSSAIKGNLQERQLVIEA